MNFLAPAAAITAAAIAIPLLVSLYLLKLRRRPLRVSSTLLWTKAVHDLQVNVPFRWLRPTWMFILQLLGLACLIAAIGRPALDARGGESSRVVLLIDRSASMSATDATLPNSERVTRLEAAKFKALAEVDALSRRGMSTSVAVVAFAAEPRLLTPLTQNLGDIRQAIRAITPSDQPADEQAAARLVAAILARGESDEARAPTADPAEVVLISDGGNARQPGTPQPTIADARLRLVRVGPPATDELDNLGITAIAARRDFEDPATVRIFVRVTSASRAREASMALDVDGVEIDRRPITVPASPDNATETFTVATREAAVVTLRLDTTDALESDNQASLVLAAATRPRVLIVAPDSRREGADWVLPVALRAMRLPVRVSPASAYERDVASGSSLNAELVVFDAVRPRSAPPIPTLSFGAGLPGFDPIAQPSPTPTRVLTWNRAHPILRSVALDALYIARPLSLPSTATDDRTTVAELARGSEGPLIAELNDRGLRRVVVGFDLNQSNWPVQITFPIFLAAAVDHLTLRGEDESGRAFTTTQPARLDVEKSPTDAMTFEGPATITARATEALGPRTTLSLGTLERAGVYRAKDIPDPIAAGAVAAANLVDSVESAIALGDQPAILGTANTATNTEGSTRELWPWFVLAALVLLSAEWILNGWRMRV